MWPVKELFVVSLLCCLPGGLASECGSFISLAENTSTTLSSPDYPGTYPNSSTCIWIIETPAQHILTINFSFVDTQQNGGGGCTDYVEVRDGSPTALQYLFTCSASDVQVSSTARWLWVKFYSDQSGTAAGFLANITSEYTGVTTNTTSPIAACDATNWRCANQMCVNLAYRCDGINDCGCVGYGCEEHACGGLSLTPDERILIGVFTGFGLFVILFFGIGFYDIWARRRAQKKYEQEMEDQKRRERQERARKNAAAIFGPSIEISSTTTPGLSRAPSSLSISPAARRKNSSVSTNPSLTPTSNKVPFFKFTKS